MARTDWIVGGIDLSPTGTAATVAALDWCPDFRKVRTWKIDGELRGDTDEERARRSERVALGLVRFGRVMGVHVFAFESYAYSQGAMRAHEIAEVCGVARLELVRHGFAIETVWMSSGRSLLLGKNPTTKRDGDPKRLVRNALRAAGAPVSWNFDVCDAFVVMNKKISDLGGRCIATVPPDRTGSRA